jgi:hypothetical protein
VDLCRVSKKPAGKSQQAFSFSIEECEGEPGHPLCSRTAARKAYQIQ